MKEAKNNSSWLWTALVLSTLLATGAQAQSLPAGQIIERVVCRHDAQQSYALYLPSQYTEQRRWPILYGFDPAGRGLRPVELFKEAAERYGYIVVGSHNSRNGPDVPLNQILTTLLQDTQTRLAIDEKRLYATGFSGGARVALSLARSLPEHIAGVIACGAGGPSEVPLRKDLPYVILGIAGNEDFNLLEMRKLARALDDVGAVNRLVTFEGAHAWPPVAVATQAIEWLELQAMKTGRRGPDTKLIEEWLQKALAQTRAAETEQRWLAALAGYEALARDFQGLREVEAFTRKAGELRASKEVKERLKREKSAEQFQEKRTQEFFSLHGQLKTADTPLLILSELRRGIADLHKKADSKEATAERTAARRTLSLFLISLNEEAARLQARKQYAEAIPSLLLLAEIRPESPQVYFNLARFQALAGNKKQALAALKQAVEKGLNVNEQIRNHPDLESLRQEAGYKQLLGN